MTTQRVFFHKAGPTLGLNVYRSYDGELLGYVERAEVESLRDLLLREFPVAAEPEWCAACGKSPCNCPAPQSAADRAYKHGWDAGWAAATSGRRHRRERIAATLFAGMLANRDTHATAMLAVSYADSLIAALDNNKE